MTLKVLIDSHEGEAFYDLLREVPNVEITQFPDDGNLAEYTAETEVYFGKPGVDILKISPKLKWIQAPSAGVEFVANIPELVESEVLLTNTRGAHGPSIGEHALAMLLAMTRHIPESVLNQAQRSWNRGAMYHTAREIGGLTMGIIGFGALGRGIAQRAKAFEMNILAVDAQAVNGEPWVDEVWPVSRINDLLAQSDVVVVACPLTAETRHLIGAEQFAEMKDDAYLIVVSRGGIVEQGALRETLIGGKLAGVAIDVAEKEPLPAEDPLWDAPRLLVTPHMAGASAPKERRCVEIFRDNLIRYQNDEPLINLVDKSRGY